MKKIKLACSTEKIQIGFLVLLFSSMILFKFASDLGYYKILSLDKTTYKLDFNLLKYINGILWCVVLFCAIRHKRRKVSTFMLYLVFLLQIIPITTIYSLGNDNPVYYNTLCFAFFLCELIVGWWPSNCKSVKRYSVSAKIILIGIVSLLLFLLVYIIIKNGLPTLMALNIYDVYELRRSDRFHIDKYMGYLMEWLVIPMLPFLLALSLSKKKYLVAAIICIVTSLIYLYTGYKSVLFGMPMVIFCTIWAKRKNSYAELFCCASIGFVLLVLLACFAPIFRRVFYEIYSLFGRRIMMVSANNKFKYFDFFSQNPKMGLGGIFPRGLINIPNPYEHIRYTFLISDIYYGKPNMDSNTGFFAEGYMRFGHLGTFGILCLFAAMLRLMDRLQKHVGYAFTVGFFAYPVMLLCDTHLFDTLLLGQWSILLVVMLFFTEYNIKEDRRRNNYVWNCWNHSQRKG